MFIQQLIFHRTTIIICTVCWLLFLFTSNRALVAGYTLSLIFVYLNCIRFRIGKIKICLCLAILAVILLSLSIFIDFDSSKGRLLIYKISLSIWQDHFFTGIGHNRFEAVYNSYQEQYFRSGTYSNSELLLADNTYYAFNDYLQFAIEHGITGIITMLAYFLFLTELIHYLIKNNRDELKSIVFFASQIIAISFASFFTHLFEQLIVVCILISSIITLCLMAYNVGIYKRIALLLLINISVICISNREYILNVQAFKQWDDAVQLSKTGAKKASIQFYKKAYSNLRHNYNYLLSYGNTLQELHHFGLALEIYSQASNLQISNRLLDNMASCHQSLGNIYQAEHFYLRSVFTVPNRFVNRCHLFNFYLATCQMKKASNCGLSILNLPVKIPSSKIDEIRTDVSRKLKTIAIL